MPEKDLTVKEVAAALRTSRQSVYNWIKEGRLAAYRVSKNGTRVRPEELERFKAEAALQFDAAEPVEVDA